MVQTTKTVALLAAALIATFALTLSACRNPLPATLPPATPRAVNTPDLTEAKKFFGTWRYTQQIHEPNAVVTARSLELAIRSDQRLFVAVKEFTDYSTEVVQQARASDHSYSAQWAQQKDAQGGKLWVMRKGPDEPPVGAYYQSGPIDKNGKSNTLTLTGAASQNKARVGALCAYPSHRGRNRGKCVSGTWTRKKEGYLTNVSSG